ncbi:hypothetical protein NPIL_210931, partial [Nephila pilipes]
MLIVKCLLASVCSESQSCGAPSVPGVDDIAIDPSSSVCAFVCCFLLGDLAISLCRTLPWAAWLGEAESGGVDLSGSGGTEIHFIFKVNNLSVVPKNQVKLHLRTIALKSAAW